MKYILIILILINATLTLAGLPPTSSKGNGESSYKTTFSTDYGTIPLSRAGTKATLGTIPITAGGTGKTTQQNTMDILVADKLNGSIITTLKDQLDHIMSAGVTSGAILTDNGNGTVNVGSSETYIRASYVITSLTQSAGTATFITSTPTDIPDGARITIRGANQSSYNNTFIITKINTTTFTFAVPNNPVSPATGTIVALESDEEIYLDTIPAITSLALTDHATNYVFVDWNGGTPIYGVTTDSRQVVGLARTVAWVITREGNTLWKIDNREFSVDSMNKANERYIRKEKLTPEAGSVLISAAANRGIAVTSGNIWYGLTTQIAPAFNTSTGDTFTYAYTSDGGATWTYTTGNTQISNTQFNSPIAGLQPIPVDGYGVSWVYEMINTPTTLMVVYGAESSTKSIAFAAQEPLYLPDIIRGGGILVGKIIMAQGASFPTAVISSFTKQFLNPSPDISSLLDVTTTSPATGEVLSWNGVRWVNSARTSASAGAGVPFFKSTPTITATSTDNTLQISTLSKTPITTTEQTTAGAATVGTPFAFGARLGPAFGVTNIPSGTWYFNLYASIDSLTGTSTITETVYDVIPSGACTVTTTGTGTTRTATVAGGCTPFVLVDASNGVTGGAFLQTPKGLYRNAIFTSSTVMIIVVPTTYVNESNVTYSKWANLFAVTSADFANTSVSLLGITPSVQPAFVVGATDLIGTIDVLTVTSTTKNILVYYNGTNHNSNLSGPFLVNHNDLPNLNGGTSGQYYHLTSAEYAGTGTGVFARSTSPVFTTPNIGSATGSISGNAATVTTNANLTGPITSTGNATAITNSSIDLTTKVTSVLPIANGGTNSSTLAANNVLLGNGTSALQVVAPSTSGNVLQSNGSTWISGTIFPQAFSLGTSDINWSLVKNLTSGMFLKALGANTTFTFSSLTTGQTIIVRLTNTASNYTVTWPTIKWSGGTIPVQTIGAKSDVYTFVYDGTDIYGSVVQNF
jgi:hypothetical protein